MMTEEARSVAFNAERAERRSRILAKTGIPMLEPQLCEPEYVSEAKSNLIYSKMMENFNAHVRFRDRLMSYVVAVACRRFGEGRNTVGDSSAEATAKMQMDAKEASRSRKDVDWVKLFREQRVIMDPSMLRTLQQRHMESRLNRHLDEKLDDIWTDGNVEEPLELRQHLYEKHLENEKQDPRSSPGGISRLEEFCRRHRERLPKPHCYDASISQRQAPSTIIPLDRIVSFKDIRGLTYPRVDSCSNVVSCTRSDDVQSPKLQDELKPAVNKRARSLHEKIQLRRPANYQPAVAHVKSLPISRTANVAQEPEIVKVFAQTQQAAPVNFKATTPSTSHQLGVPIAIHRKKTSDTMRTKHPSKHDASGAQKDKQGVAVVTSDLTITSFGKNKCVPAGFISACNDRGSKRKGKYSVAKRTRLYPTLDCPPAPKTPKVKQKVSKVPQNEGTSSNVAAYDFGMTTQNNPVPKVSQKEGRSSNVFSNGYGKVKQDVQLSHQEDKQYALSNGKKLKNKGRSRKDKIVDRRSRKKDGRNLWKYRKTSNSHDRESTLGSATTARKKHLRDTHPPHNKRNDATQIQMQGNSSSTSTNVHPSEKRNWFDYLTLQRKHEGYRGLYKSYRKPEMPADEIDEKMRKFGFLSAVAAMQNRPNVHKLFDEDRKNVVLDDATLMQERRRLEAEEQERRRLSLANREEGHYIGRLTFVPQWLRTSTAQRRVYDTDTTSNTTGYNTNSLASLIGASKLHRPTTLKGIRASHIQPPSYASVVTRAIGSATQAIRS